MSRDALSSVTRVREERVNLEVPLYVHHGWAERFPWLLQGITGRSLEGRAFDLALFGDTSPGAVGRWVRLAEAAGFPSVVVSRQVHGADVHVHDEGATGLLIRPPADGHVTRTPGLLLAVTVADCVPVFVADPARRAVALLHAGWRGAAAGIVERGLGALGRLAGSRPDELHVHLGPAICGACYQVGAEVFEALRVRAGADKGYLDLRAVLAARVEEAGVDPARITLSSHCTRCDGGSFFSHRGGDAGRLAALLGVRP